MKNFKPKNRIREAAEDPTHGVTVHPGILYLTELVAALKKGPEEVKRVVEMNSVYLLGLTVEEGREIAKISNALRGIK